MNAMRELLRSVYLEALEATAPERLVAEALSLEPALQALPVVAIGKAAASMAAGAGPRIARSLVVAPAGYATAALDPLVEVVLGGHPEIGPASFAAGRRLIEFVRSSSSPLLVLLSGGASAAAEVPLEPWFGESEVARINSILIRSGLPIESINAVRKHVSAIKGGRLARYLPPGSSALIYSDVPRGRPELVGSGPLHGDLSTKQEAAEILESTGEPFAIAAARIIRDPSFPETPKSTAISSRTLADNATLVEAAAAAVPKRGLQAAIGEEEVAGDVEGVARQFAGIVHSLAPGSVWVGGGEPTVVVRGRGEGGRCSELALRFLRAAREGGLRDFTVLFGSSDGVDGSSGAAAYLLDDRSDAGATEIAAALEGSDSAPLAAAAAEAIIMRPNGNNLRDLYLLARR
jgi:glycerate 2-kinase